MSDGKTTRPGKLRERTTTVLFMLAVTFVSISIVSALHLATAETVRQNESLFMKRAVLEACGMDDVSDRDTVLGRYAEWVPADADGESNGVLKLTDPETGDLTGYVFVRDGAGLWGTITAVVGMDTELSSFTGVTFVKQNETPGLGARIDEDWFKKQFRGKTGPFTFVDEGTQSASATEFDAITGATITTRAVRDILNGVIEDAPKLVSQD